MEPDGRSPSRFGVHVAFACGLVGLADGLATLVGTVLPLSAYLALAAGFGALTWRIGRREARLARTRAAILGGVFVLSLALWPLGERKAFFRDVDRIEVGTARVDVRARMTGYTDGHPYGPHWPFGAVSDATSDVWSLANGSVDHVVVRYDDTDRVRAVERIVD